MRAKLSNLWEQSANAAEELAVELLGVGVRKAIDPLTPEGFLIIGNRIAAALAKATQGAEAGVVQQVLATLNLDWKKLSTEAVDRAVNAANTALGKHYNAVVLPKVADVLELEGPKVMKGTKAAILARESIEIAASLSARDLEGEAAIRASQVNFIRNSNGLRIESASTKARDIVARGLEQGVDRNVMAGDLRKHFETSIPRPTSYWGVVSSAFVGRARSTSQVYAYEDAGIETFEVVAVLDEVTTDQCRFMDGKVFTVAAARGLLDSLNTLEDPEDVKYANPWIRKGKDGSGNARLFIPNADGSHTTLAKITRSGVGARDDAGEFSGGKSAGKLSKLGVQFPPYHGHCRTVIVAGAESSGDKRKPMVPGSDLESVPDSAGVVEPDAQDAPLPPEQTVEYHEKKLKKQYGDAARTVGYGKAMAERGRALTFDSFANGVEDLQSIGIASEDPRVFAFVKNMIEEGDLKTVGQLVDGLGARVTSLSGDLKSTLGMKAYLDLQASIATTSALKSELEVGSRLVSHRTAITPHLGKIDMSSAVVKTDFAIGPGKRPPVVSLSDFGEEVDYTRITYQGLTHKDLKHPTTYTFVADDKRRGWHAAPGHPKKDEEMTINVGAGKKANDAGERMKTLRHEWGHAIEALNDSRLARAVDYLDARAGKAASKPPVQLKGYPPGEKGRKDKLFSPYMGKDYSASVAPFTQALYKGRWGTEVTSMSVQHITNVAKLAREVFRVDPDTVDFILGQLANQ